MSKSPKKTTSKKTNGKTATATRKPNPLHEKLIRLMSRPDGATLHDLWNSGFQQPSVFALKIAERHGLKTSIVKKKGELTRYIAKRAAQ
jgi:hypothetical protein